MARKKKQFAGQAAKELNKQINASIKKGNKKRALLLIAAGLVLALYSGRSINPYLSDLGKVTEGGLLSGEDTSGTEAAAEAEEAKLESVVDGDTLWVRVNGARKKVRLLQINAPESVHSDESKNTSYGREASAHLKEMLADVDTVWMTRDYSDEDQYGRLLRMIWLKKPSDPFSEAELRENCVNARMLLDGYAQVVVFDDKSYTDLFDSFVSEAKKHKNGLWAEDGWKRYVREHE
ncbi:MAG: thermonuclease family protein [Eubacteriales bacterium]|nr:thermonuclease family protein [Eubacteriales bacterium]